jgi:muramoyltetrapeptide carboxypeptidase LdcA involved in peptidoglycan recycling
MSSRFTYPSKPERGDRVAVLSPSGRAAARFPAPFDLGLRRLRDEFDLVPVEYPTTRATDASPAERGRDIHAAWTDPTIKAVVATIGGEDELKVLAHLDPTPFVASPKPFFGYSDNTNLHLFLWNLGLVAYHGGAVMVQLGRPGSMHPTTRAALERAMFTHGAYVLEPPSQYGDEEADWRGLLQQFAAVLWARPKAWSFEQPRAVAERASYVEAQRDAVLTALAEYHPEVPVVFGVDFGHTDPQYVIPSGGEITVDGERQRIEVRY